MNEQQQKQRFDDIDEKLDKIEKMLKEGYVNNLFQYVQTIMSELRDIRARL